MVVVWWYGGTHTSVGVLDKNLFFKVKKIGPCRRKRPLIEKPCRRTATKLSSHHQLSEMETSLMALDHSGDPTVPLLSNGPPIEEESEFSRLIEQRSTIDDHILGFQRLIPDELSFSLNLEAPGGGRSRVVVDDKPRGPLLTAAAGTLCLVHLGMVWGAYLNTWSQTHLIFSVDWQSKLLPFLDSATDQVIRTTSLASFLQDLDQCHAYLLMMLVWATALVIPCLFMVVSPTMVVGDYIRSFDLQQRRLLFDGRVSLELFTRFAWLPIFSLALISMATSFVDLEWTGTVIRAGMRSKNPFAAYIVGTLCGVGLLALLRVPRQETFKIVPDDLVEIEFAPATPVRSPPPQAFRHTWQVEDEDAPLMTVLEEDVMSPVTPTRPSPPPRTPSPDNVTPELVEEASVRPSSPPRLSYWDKVKVFQLGLLSVTFWIPAYYLPLLHFNYTGVASDFMQRSSFRLYLWEVPSYLWSQGREFDTPFWIVALLVLFVTVTVLVVPLVATFQGVLAWLGEGAWRTRSYVWLYAAHPCLGGLVFSLALLTTVPVLSPMGVVLLDEHATNVCHGLTGDPCLGLKAQLLSGSAFYLAQSLCLEAFVFLTLIWSRRS